MRLLLKAFKTEIVPNKEQRMKIIRSIGVARFLYNQYIAYNRQLYKMYQRGILDENQKHFATANDFDKYVASVDKITDSEREKIILSGDYLPSYMWNVNGWLCKKLGLTIKKQSQITVPTTYKEDIYSDTLKMNIKSGDATGMSAIVKTETLEGVEIEYECIGKVYSKEDFDKNEWTIYGEPDTTITVARPDTVRLTCATIINRIPDVINAKAGFRLTCEMDELMYRAHSLENYLK